MQKQLLHVQWNLEEATRANDELTQQLQIRDESIQKAVQKQSESETKITELQQKLKVVRLVNHFLKGLKG